MSEARELYYIEINNPWHKTRRAQIENYVSELEQQKAELIQLLKEIDDNVLIEWPYEYSYYRNRVAEIINK